MLALLVRMVTLFFPADSFATQAMALAGEVYILSTVIQSAAAPEHFDKELELITSEDSRIKATARAKATVYGDSLAIALSPLKLTNFGTRGEPVQVNGFRLGIAKASQRGQSEVVRWSNTVPLSIPLASGQFVRVDGKAFEIPVDGLVLNACWLVIEINASSKSRHPIHIYARSSNLNVPYDSSAHEDIAP